MVIVNKDQLTESEILEILKFINDFRKEFDIPNLIYDKHISDICKINAINYLKSKIQKIEYNAYKNDNLEKPNELSENLIFVNGVRNHKMQNIKNIIKKWYAEQKYYDFENEDNIKYKSCQNFINLVWESNIKCGFWYSYSNGRCAFCMQFSE